MSDSRQFLGIWIPSDIWLNKNLDAIDKCLLAEIESLGGSKTGCYASNKFLSEFLGCGIRNLQDKLDKLKRLDLIESKLIKNTRFLFVKACTPVHPPMHSSSPPPCTPVHPHTIYIENKEENKEENSFFNAEDGEKEKIKTNENIEVCSLEELRECVKLGVAREEIPWRDVETCLGDWWLLCEMKGYRIKKRSAHLGFMKYLRGGDKKKMEDEKQEWIESQRKKQYRQNLQETENREKLEAEKKEREAIEYMRRNPQKMAEIEAQAYERALVLVKGNKNALSPLILNGLAKKVAWEMSKDLIHKN